MILFKSSKILKKLNVVEKELVEIKEEVQRMKTFLDNSHLVSTAKKDKYRIISESDSK